MSSKDMARRRLLITGQVQGVGFRPFIYRIASVSGVSGFVGNQAGSVILEAQGRRANLADFLRRLRTQAPPLAKIATVKSSNQPVVEGDGHFTIAPSVGGEMADAQVTVDTVVCGDCLRELFDPADRRYKYPFINCTNCGPRYSIVRRVPYDRPNTTMSVFPLCEPCAKEYKDPGDRRYHAQPIACPACGPRIWLADSHGKRIECDDAIAAAAELLREGKVVAIKGLGGFQLAVRADDDHAVRRLRMRKNRQAKPFALMARDLAEVRELVHLPPEALAVLQSPRGPIVLLERLKNASVAESVAPGTHQLGIMLPTTPIHHLLFRLHDLPALVMTSGNISEEPLVKDNEDAVAHLGRIADAFLLHDRAIERRVDDSVVMIDGTGAAVPIRRARGYAPAPVQLKMANRPATPILAVGAELKNAFCLYSEGRALVSEHIGDLKDGRVYRQFMQTIAHLEALYDIHPLVLAADMHPGYLSTQYAVQRSKGHMSGRPAVPLIFVQHHHAHIASVLAEHGRVEPVIGIAADGTGYGPDGAVWGGEILRADLTGYSRLGHLKYFGLPGGDLASHETFRPAVSVLADTFGERWARTAWLTERLGVDKKRIHAAMELLKTNTNSPMSSSLGRLFDAAAALCGVAQDNVFEGQAPMALEAAARDGVTDAYDFVIAGEGKFEIDYRPMIEQMVLQLRRGAEVPDVAARFHNTVADFLQASALRAREMTGLQTVALSGGCFANHRLTARLVAGLKHEGFEVLLHRQMPCNDGGVALGQAVVAAFTHARLQPSRPTRALLEGPSSAAGQSGEKKKKE